MASRVFAFLQRTLQLLFSLTGSRDLCIGVHSMSVLRLRTCPSNSRFISSSCKILLSVRFSIQLIRNILRQSHISIDVILRSSRIFRVQASAPYDKTVHTNVLTSLIFSATGMDRSFHKVVSSHILLFAIAMRAFTSLEQSPSVDEYRN